MKTYYVSALCTALVLGGALAAGPAEARFNGLADVGVGGFFQQKHEPRAPHVRQQDPKVLSNHSPGNTPISVNNQLPNGGGAIAVSTQSPSGSNPVSVPEPSTLLLLGSSFVALAMWHLRKRKGDGV